MPGRRRQRFGDSRRRPRPDRTQLTRHFVGTEGTGERALARWIESLCVDAGHKILFDVPETEKNQIARADLRERFSLSDLQRVAQFDNNLLILLHELGLDNA